MTDGTGETGAMCCNSCSAPTWGCHCACVEDLANLQAGKDRAYTERDRLVAALSKMLPAWLERHPEDEEWEDDWRWIVFIDGPAGQMTWHIHDSELGWFDHLTRSSAHRWDGHTTEEKYRRLEGLWAEDAG